jgi:hypothetical protein
LQLVQLFAANTLETKCWLAYLRDRSTLCNDNEIERLEMSLGSALRSLRTRKRRPRAQRAVIAMTVIGVVTGLLYGLFSDAIYRTRAVVFVDPQAVSLALGNTDPAAQAVFISNFITSVTSPEAIAAASRKSGLDASEIRDNISASQIGSTNAVEVSYRGRAPEKDGAIVRGAAETALSSFTSSGLSRLERQVQLYRDNYDEKSNAVANFVANTSETEPGEHYNQVQLELIRAGNNDANLQGELSRLQPLVVGYGNLVDERVRAGNLLQGALDRKFQLQSSADLPDASISVTTASKVSAVSTILRYCILFGAAGLLLGLAFLAARWAIIRIRSASPNVGNTLGSDGNGSVAVASTTSADDHDDDHGVGSNGSVAVASTTSADEHDDHHDVGSNGSVVVASTTSADDHDLGDQSK